jgi:hypothetical protein
MLLLLTPKPGDNLLSQSLHLSASSLRIPLYTQNHILLCVEGKQQGTNPEGCQQFLGNISTFHTTKAEYSFFVKCT